VIDPNPLDVLMSSKYLRLTTFRRDGRPVATPVWMVRDGEALLVTTTTTTGKVKRLRHTPRVLLAPCDRRGLVAEGMTDVEGTGEVLTDEASLSRLDQLLRRRYGLLYRMIAWMPRRGEAQTCCLRLTVG